MKGNGKLLLAAVMIGVVFPGMIFSVAEKLYADKLPQIPIIATLETPSYSDIDSVNTKDFVLFLQENGEIIKMDMDEYLTGVLLGEIPADFDDETLKAQAVVARTYARKRMLTGNKHEQGAVCGASACCQAFCSPKEYLNNGGKEETVEKFGNAVKLTSGLVLIYQGNLIEATYFSCSGGMTEDAVAVWGTQIPYLQAVDSPGEENATHYQDHIRFTADEFATELGIITKGSPSSWFGNVTYTAGGGVDTFMIAGRLFNGIELRQKLGLNSTAFSVSVNGDIINIYTKGFGHRVGMSQYGAEAMALDGSRYAEILAHYYAGTELYCYLD